MWLWRRNSGAKATSISFPVSTSTWAGVSTRKPSTVPPPRQGCRRSYPALTAPPLGLHLPRRGQPDHGRIPLARPRRHWGHPPIYGHLVPASWDRDRTALDNARTASGTQPGLDTPRSEVTVTRSMSILSATSWRYPATYRSSSGARRPGRLRALTLPGRGPGCRLGSGAGNRAGSTEREAASSPGHLLHEAPRAAGR